jgi:hypothetical protein
MPFFSTLFKIPTIKMVITILVVMLKISLNLGSMKRQDYEKKKRENKENLLHSPLYMHIPKKRAALQSIVLLKKAC